MQETYNNKYDKNLDNEISLLEFFQLLLQEKWKIISLTAFVTFCGIIYSLLLPNIYESKALLVHANSSSGISGALGSYSGLAGLAGINLSSGGDNNNSIQAMEKINSLSFFENIILTNIFLPDLMAVKSWDFETNTITYDESIYDKNTDIWVREYSYPMKKIPSAQESFKKFKDDHMSLNESKDTGYITLSIKHQSPFVAKEWTELIVDEVNNFYRQKDKLESQKAVNYLNQQISMTNLSETKQAIAKLIQEEIQKLTLIEANQAYVFDYIDPPAVMEQKSKPNRTLICILFALFGGILSIVLVLFKLYSFK